MPISIVSQATCAANRIADFEALQERLFELSRGQPGCQGGVLLCSLSRPLQYTRGSIWDDLSAVKTFWKSQAFQDFAQQSANDTIATFTRPVECYEAIETVRDPGTPTFVITIERTIKPGMLDAFVESRRELFKLQRSQGTGAVTSGLSRLAGSNNQTLAYLSFLSQADATAFFTSAAYQAWAEKHGNTYDAAPPVIEGCQPVLIYAPVQA